MAEEFASFNLADWHANTQTNELRKGDDCVKIEAKVMQVLHYLALHPGRLVSREELEQAVWKNTVVGYDALTGAIAKIRKTLGDDSRQPKYIETIAKKGYRLCCAVSVGEQDAQAGLPMPEPHQQKQKATRHNKQVWLAGMLMLLVLVMLGILNWYEPVTHTSASRVSTPSIVVLPFRNLGSDQAQEYLSYGMTADITTALSKISGLRVIAPDSAQSFADRPGELIIDEPDNKTVAEALGVQYVLTGSVRHVEKRIRVNVSLIDAATNTYLWSEKYDRQWLKLLDVQDEITAKIISALAIELTAQETQRTARRYTQNIAAYDAFLRGQALYMHHTEEDNRQARNYFKQAIVLDKNFARAYSSMALTYVAEHRYGWNREAEKTAGDNLTEALELATKGAELDPELPQAYWVLAYVHLFRHDYQQASVAARHSIEMAPSYADSYISLAVSQMHSGAGKEAVELVQKAMLLNPKYPAAYASVLGQVYFYMGEYESAIALLNEAIARNSNLLTPHLFMAVAQLKLNRNDEARWSAEQIRLISPDFNASQVDDVLPLYDKNVIASIKQSLGEIGL